MPARSITTQTGWKRPSPLAICQGIDILSRVTEYDFDLHDPEFKAYCHARGVLYKAGKDTRFQFTANHQATKEDFFEKFRLAEPIHGRQYRFTDAEMETHWTIMLAAKGAMQDCWELFTQTAKPTKEQLNGTACIHCSREDRPMQPIPGAHSPQSAQLFICDHCAATH